MKKVFIVLFEHKNDKVIAEDIYFVTESLELAQKHMEDRIDKTGLSTYKIIERPLVSDLMNRSNLEQSVDDGSLK